MEVEPMSVQIMGALINFVLIGTLAWVICWVLKKSEYR